MRASFLFLVPTRLLVNSNSARYLAFRLHTSVAFHEITPIETERKDITYQKNRVAVPNPGDKIVYLVLIIMYELEFVFGQNKKCNPINTSLKMIRFYQFKQSVLIV